MPQQEPGDAPRAAAPWRILLVEDDEPVRERLVQILQAWDGVQALAACARLDEALALMAAQPVDLLVTDLKLPDGHGVQAIRRLKALHPAAEAMVISVLADERSVLEAIEAGAAGYLLKDAYALDLIEAIVDLMAGRSPISSSIARLLVRRLAGQDGAVRGDGSAPALTAREMDILWGIAKGFTYEELAGRLGISRQTVPVHIRNIYRKLSVNNRSEAVFEARQRGLLPR